MNISDILFLFDKSTFLLFCCIFDKSTFLISEWVMSNNGRSPVIDHLKLTLGRLKGIDTDHCNRLIFFLLVSIHGLFLFWDILLPLLWDVARRPQNWTGLIWDAIYSLFIFCDRPNFEMAGRYLVIIWLAGPKIFFQPVVLFLWRMFLYYLSIGIWPLLFL